MLVRAETQIKIGRSQCNIVMSRIKPWLLLKPPPNKKKMVIKEEAPVAKPKSTDDSKAIVWTCNLSASDLTIMLFSMAGSPLYHVSILPYIYVCLYINTYVCMYVYIVVICESK